MGLVLPFSLALALARALEPTLALSLSRASSPALALKCPVRVQGKGKVQG